MKTKRKTHTHTDHDSISTNKAKDMAFESLASHLDLLAKGKLPDGCLNGVLTGQEPEIRQDGILLALRWFGKCTNKDEWNPAASIAYALRYIKLRYARRLSKQPHRVQLYEDVMPGGLILETPDTNPMSRRPHATQMAVKAIHKANKCGRISTSNAAIALMVLQDGQTVGTIAEKLKLTSGAIHYHIGRVRAALPAILANIEEPGYCQNFEDHDEHL